MTAAQVVLRLAVSGQAQVSGALNSVSQQLSALGPAAKAMAVGLAAVGAAAAVAWGRNAINAADQASKMAQRMGVATSQVAGLRLAFELGGSSAEGMTQAVSRLSSHIADNSKTLASMGVQTRDVTGRVRETREVLGDVAARFAGYADNAAKTALAIDLFGVSGAQIIPVLNGGAAALDRMDSMAAKLGLTVDDKTGPAAEQFNDTLTLLARAGEGVATQVAAQLLPTLQSLAGTLLDAMTSGDRLSRASDVLSAALRGLFIVGAVGVEVFTTIGKTLGTVAAAVVAVATGEFRQAQQILAEGGKDILAGWGDTADFVKRAWSGVGDDGVAAMAAITKASAPATASLTKGASDAGKAYQSLAADMRKTLDEQAALIAAGGQLSAAQRLELSLAQRMAAVLPGLSASRARELRALADQVVAGQAAADALVQQAKAQQELEQAQRAASDAMAGQEAAGERLLDGLRDQYIALVAGREAMEAIVIMRLEDAAAMHDQQAAMLTLTAEATAHHRLMAQQLREQIALRKGIAAATAGAEIDKANADAARRAAEDWQRASDQIGQSLADALMAGGKNAGEYIKGLFRSMVLRPMLQATVQPIAGAITGALGFAQPAMAAGQAAGGLGNLAGMAGLAGSIGTFGTTLGMGASATMAGSSMAAFSGASSMIGAGNVAGGLGMGLGAAMPYIGAAMAVYAIAKHFDKSGTPHMGSVVSGSGTDLRTLMGDRSQITNNLDAGTDQALRSMITATTGILSALGGGQYTATARYASDNTDPSIGQFTLARDGQQVGFVGTANNGSATGTGADYIRYNRDAATGLEEFTRDVVRATRAQLDGMDLPAWARKQLDGLAQDADLQQLAGVAAAIQATTEGIATLRATMEPLSGVFQQFAGMTSDAIFSVTEALGGAAALAQAASVYYGSYYTEAERAADTTRQITAALGAVGLAVPESRDAFRALVEAQDLSSAAGRQNFAVLMNVAGAFAELNPIVEATATAARSAVDILRERERLEVELLRLQGDAAELRRRELEALDPSNQALQQSIYAYQDQAAAAAAASEAARAEAAAMDAAAASARQYLDAFNGIIGGLFDSRFDLEQQLLELEGRSGEAAVRLRERNLARMTEGLTEADAAAVIEAYDYNDALREQVKALSGAQRSVSDFGAVAVQSAATVRDAMAGVWDSIADEIRRLRGLTRSGPEALSAIAAQFATATAAARAGDAEAAKRLPTLSRQLDDLAQASAGSAAELAIMRGRTAASLETTLTATGGDSTLADLRQDVKQLREDLVAAMAQNASYAQRTAKALERAMPDGDALATRAAT
jgi:hypothetical protein